MIIIIISGTLLILSIIGILIWHDWIGWWGVRKVLGIVSIGVFVCSAVMMCISIGIIIKVHCASRNDIHNAAIERECIVKQIECITSDYEDASKVEVIRSISEWNKKVHTAYYWANNLWTNWFWDKNYVDSLQYIEMDNLKVE